MRRRRPSALKSPPPFNLNTISRGISTADFYLAVPTAVMNALESDTKTRLLAKPQLRGAEGAKLTLNLGQEVPIVTTSYTPIATGGVGTNPLNSFQLKPVGINIDMTPRVTLDGDILLELNIESSSEGTARNVAGTNYPSFVSRKVGTRLRLRDGESNLLAGPLTGRRLDGGAGIPGRDSRAAAISSLVLEQQSQISNRSHHAVDAAHRSDQRDRRKRSPADLYRLAAESRARWSAAAHRADAGARAAGRTGSRNRAGATTPDDPGRAGESTPGAPATTQAHRRRRR